MSRLISGRVKKTPQTGITSDRYQFLGLEQAEPNLGDPLVGPSSLTANPVPGGTQNTNKYVLITVAGNEGKRYWSSLTDIGAGGGAGIVTYSEYSGVSTSVIGGIGIVTSLSVTGGQISTSSSTGALIVSGGVGIGSSAFIAGNIEVNGIPIGNNGSGINNFFVGTGAGANNTIGSQNNFLGYLAGNYNTTGYYNNFFGRESGVNNNSGNNNNFLGYSSGESNDSGSDNNFFGKFTGRLNQNGNYNNFFGSNSGSSNLTGSYNIFVGRGAGSANESGSNNIYFGTNAGSDNVSGTNNVVIGNSQQAPITSGDNQLAIGIGNTSWIIGNSSYNIGIGTTNPTSKLTVNGGFFVSGISTFGGKLIPTDDGIYDVGRESIIGQGAYRWRNANFYGYGKFGSGVTASDVEIGITSSNYITSTSGNLVIDSTGGIVVSNKDLKVGVGTSTGIILTSPNGTQYRIKVDNSGNLSTVAV